MAAKVNGFSLAYTAIGGVVLWSGIKGTTLSSTFRGPAPGAGPDGEPGADQRPRRRPTRRRTRHRWVSGRRPGAGRGDVDRELQPGADGRLDYGWGKGAQPSSSSGRGPPPAPLSCGQLFGGQWCIAAGLGLSMKCNQPDCDKQLRSDNRSGYCQAHWNKSIARADSDRSYRQRPATAARMAAWHAACAPEILSLRARGPGPRSAGCPLRSPRRTSSSQSSARYSGSGWSTAEASKAPARTAQASIGSFLSWAMSQAISG